MQPTLKILLLAIVAATLAGCRATFAPTLPKERNEQVFQINEKTEAYSTAEALQRFNETPSTTYRIGAGDHLTIEVWNRPELSGEHVVGPDGFVTLPLSGPIKLLGLDREQSNQAVNEALSRFYQDVKATIRVDEYVSNRILILGRVSNPGALHFVNPPTLLDAITLAGGLPVGGTGSEKATLTRCAVFRGRDRIVWINLSELLSGRDLNLNLQLQANDLVYIPDADDQLVYALGEVAQPGAYNLSPEMTLLDIISRAGGLTKDANSKQVSLVRPSENVSMTVDIKELLAPNRELNVSLRQGDVLYVPTSGWGKTGYVMSQLNPLASFILFTEAVSGGNNND